VAEAIARGTAPAPLNFIFQVAARFNVTVSRKVLALGLPALGSLTGAVINAAFTEHFNSVARYQFGVRMLERRRGREVTHAAYQAELRGLNAASSRQRFLGLGRNEPPRPGSGDPEAGSVGPSPSAP
jgi:hypothetical protein